MGTIINTWLKESTLTVGLKCETVASHVQVQRFVMLCRICGSTYIF